MNTAIHTKNLVKNYDSITAVDDLNLSIRGGELFGLLGPNGSGKSTTVKLLTGQIRPDSGSVEVLGTDVLAEPVKARTAVGIVPEQETPPSFLTAEEYLQFVASVRGLDESVNDRIEFWFEYLAFGDAGNRLCKDLSRGTRQKLMFAQAFLHEPKLAIIDEPLINLDPVIQRKVKDYLISYTKEGNTVFLCTHILPIAEEICSLIGIIHRGRLIYEGPVGGMAELNGNLELSFLELLNRTELEE